MEIIKFEYYNQDLLFENLRKVHLKNQPDKKIYSNSEFELVEKAPEKMVFPQYYVLEKDLDEITQCRQALLEFGVDIFKLKGFVRVYSFNEKGQQQVFDVLPPVMEISEADGGIPLLNDGMHRVYLAREAGSKINVVLASKVAPDYPYYAFPNREGWNNLQKCKEVPDIKKNYRQTDYKALFRDFNSAFINVTQPRANKKNKTLKVQGEKVLVHG
ncbi:MAG: hypothetical protein ACLFQV_09610 [Vulcanimicrobiota bacterium]